MRFENCLKNFVASFVLAASACAAFGGVAPTGEVWFGGQGPASGTYSGLPDNRVGHINTDGSDPMVVVVDPSSANCETVGVDSSNNLYFGLWSDGTLRSGSVAGGQLQSIQITDTALDDEANAFAVDPTHHIIYLGLWGADTNGADLIEVFYNPTNGQMISPYNYRTGKITNEVGVLLSEASTSNNFVLPRQMWVTPGGGQIYYVDDDNGDPNNATLGGEQLNGVYVVSTTGTNPQPKMLTLSSQFPGNDTNGYIVGLAVNTSQNLIYFATAGPAPGVDTASNAIWSIPITGNTNATVMPMPPGVLLMYPNFYGGCMALDTNAQVLYISDQGQGTILQLSLSADGTSFSGGTTNFYTLDSDHLNDASGFPSAFTQGLAFVPTVIPTPPARLTIVQQGQNVVLSWPFADSGYNLQVASELAPDAWTNYPGASSINGSTISVTNAINGAQQFFRLSQQ
jgi:hypothetical protein